MKLYLTTILALACLLSSPSSVLAKDKETPPGLKNKGGVPPGLQKKGGLPPGQAKKRGQPVDAPSDKGEDADKEKESIVKEDSEQQLEKTKAKEKGSVTDRSDKAEELKTEPKATRSDTPRDKVPDATEPLRPTRKVSREIRHQQIRVEDEVESINKLAEDPAARSAILRRLTRKQKVSKEEIESQLVGYPRLGLGGLYAARYLSAKSRQPLEVIAWQHEAGLGWGELATEHRVDVPQFLKVINEVEKVGRQAKSDKR